MENVRKHPKANCGECPLREEGAYVPTLYGTGKIGVVGKAPGRHEAATGIPFTGPSGEVLDKVLEHYGVSRREVTFSNSVSCSLPDPNDDPPKAAIAACSERLAADLARSSASIWLGLGGVGASALLGSKQTISKARVGPPRHTSHGLVIPTWHSAYCLRVPDAFPSFVKDVGKIHPENLPDLWQPPEYRVINDPNQAVEVLNNLIKRRYEQNQTRIVIDIEAATDKDFDDSHPEDYEILCIGVGFAKQAVLVFTGNVFQHEDAVQAFSRLLDVADIEAWNCFTGDTEIITKNGVERLDQINGEVEVWTKEGWQKGYGQCFGEDNVYEIELVPARYRSNIVHKIKATANHRWPTTRGEIKTTAQLSIGNKIQAEKVEVHPREDSEAFIHGLIFADGWLPQKQPKHKKHIRHQMRLCGWKSRYAHLFSSISYAPSHKGDPTVYYNSETNMKELPTADKDFQYIADFIHGWQLYDGTDFGKNRDVRTCSKKAAVWLAKNAAIGGWFNTGGSSHILDTEFSRSTHTHSIILSKGNYKKPIEWRVKSISLIEGTHKVYCVTVPNVERFTLASGVYTGNCKFDLKGTSPLVGLKNAARDGMLMSYVLDERPRQHGLKMRAVEDLGAPQYDAEIEQYTKGKDGSFAKIPKDLLHKYNAYDVSCTWDEIDYLWAKMSDKQHELHDFLIQASNMLAEVEMEKFRFDVEYNNELEKDYAERIRISEEKIHAHVGYRLNPRSPQQVMKFFGEHGYLIEHTEREYLELILKKDEVDDYAKTFIKLLLENRKLSKLMGTYIKGLRKKVDSQGKVGTTFLLHGTTSGRLASRNPNLQNLCYSEDTEILTNVGWKLFKNLDGSEKVAQWNNDGSINFVKPTEYISYLYKGNMISFKAGDHVSLLMTPNHTIISKSRDGNIFKNRADYYLRVGASGKIVDRKLIRGGDKKEGLKLSVEGKISLEKAIAFQADGYFCKDQFPGHCAIMVVSERKKEQLKKIFSDVRLHYSASYGSKFATYMKVSDSDLNYWLDMETKNFKPEAILSLRGEDLKFFLTAIMRWDGDFTRGFTYLQREERRISVEVVQAAATLCGKSTSLYIKDKYYCVNIHPKADRYFSRTNVKEVDYKGNVYCVTVPSGAIIVRRNGTPIVCGNSRGETVRNQFTAELGKVLVHVDYSQIEFRIIATLAQVPYLQKVFSDPDVDVFNNICDQIWGSGNWNKENRVSIKSVIYGLSYGRKEKSISQEINKSVTYVKELLREFRQLMPELFEWQKEIKRAVLNGEDLTTPFGRKRSFHLVMDDNREDVFNEALSFKPQSIASDICLRSAIILQPMLKEKFGAPIKLLIHDAIVAQCRPEQVMDLQELMIKEMVRSGAEYTNYVPFACQATNAFRLGEL